MAPQTRSISMVLYGDECRITYVALGDFSEEKIREFLDNGYVNVDREVALRGLAEVLGVTPNPRNLAEKV